ncbi:polyprenyl synthetase family protein [Paenibacillus sp. N1-5-1-14]|nr:farnesyl diphosphate synthase [Paenibacillus radicibacter]MCR8642407.1 polyprenyl synthetase family protein [Paenibacillus radicibacter]
MADHAKVVENSLRAGMPEQWNIPGVLRESIQYSLMAGGKRLRPILVLAAAEALGAETSAALPVASAIEMIHTYSLIHDDLPAMDNDDYRRGRLTNHKVFGEGMAILAGDALITHAFYAVVQAARTAEVDPVQVLSIVEELAQYAGAPGMVGGQAADILGEQGLTKLEELEFIHLRKTSDLIVFSLRSGARIAGATDEQLEALTEFGTCIGLAFQIQDDILDLTGDETKLGKPVRSDEKLAKVTYPYFIGIEASMQRVDELTQQGKSALTNSDIPYTNRLLQLADYLMKRDH